MLGGFLGMGETTLFIPVDAISSFTKDEVQIDHTGEKVAGAPPYDPSLVNDRQYHENIYRHFGYDPYWVGGYAYPMILFGRVKNSRTVWNAVLNA